MDMIDGIQPPKRPSSAKKPAKLNVQDTDEPTFRPPEAVAAAETAPVKDITEPLAPKRFDAPKADTKPGKFNFIEKFQGLTKKQKIIAVIALVVVLGGLAGGGYALFKKPAAKPAPAVVEQKKEEAPKATPIYSPLTGIAVTKEQSELPITAIMIENSPDARPQSGLNQAGVVFEAIAEGGITRFLTLWQEAQPDYVGPVRSVRPYYVDWLEGFDAAVAHVGGSPEALQKIKDDGTKDLDQFYNPGPYHRVSNRYAPHNMYTSLAGLIDLEKSKGWTSSKFTGFPRKAEKPSDAPTARSIDIAISGPLYNVHYDYDLASNSYKRSEGGRPHIDERSKAQISPKVVIAIVIPYSIQGDGIHSTYGTIGSGKAYIFQDGNSVEGTWEKTSSKSQIVFKDAAGQPLPLNPGQTWITATSIANNVVYKP
jgi:hypothetical protein